MDTVAIKIPALLYHVTARSKADDITHLGLQPALYVDNAPVNEDPYFTPQSNCVYLYTQKPLAIYDNQCLFSIDSSLLDHEQLRCDEDYPQKLWISGQTALFNSYNFTSSPPELPTYNSTVMAEHLGTWADLQDMADARLVQDCIDNHQTVAYAQTIEPAAFTIA